MTAGKQWALVGVVVAAMAGGVFTASRLLHDTIEPLRIGGKAPAFSAITVDETPRVRTLADYKGEVVLLNMWGTFCDPCRTEMPSMEALFRDMKPKGLKVVAISVDPPGKAREIRDFVKEFGLSFDILYDTSGAIQETYQTSGVPQSFVIARDGTIHKKWIGADDWNSEGNRRLIEQLLAESR